jgi:hypothetical protein
MGHDSGDRPFAGIRAGHTLHVGIHVGEDAFVGRAHIAQPRLSVLSARRAVSGTICAAGKSNGAVQTLLRQEIEFVAAEFALTFGRQQLR